MKGIASISRGIRSSGLAGDPPVVWLFWLAFIVFVVGSGWAARKYGGFAFWPGLFGNFGASLAAFILALTWDHDMEWRRVARAEEAERADREREALEFRERLATEARRRLEPVREELRRDKVSLDHLALEFASGAPAPDRLLHPELLEAAWTANAARLSEILGDYDLVSRLASTYGRIEELRWRLRERTSHIAFAPQISQALARMTKGLIDELVVEVGDLLERVAAQIAEPTIQRVGRIATDSATVTGVAVITGAAQSLTAGGPLDEPPEA